jgi:pyridoxamine 5'-phosphate oxidase
LEVISRFEFTLNFRVVFRGFLEGRDRLQIVTDDRAEKVERIRENTWGEGCWYFPKTREQFRLSGQLTVQWVDRLELRPEPQNRWIYRRQCDRSRLVAAVNP